jgi:hypothetical protein
MKNYMMIFLGPTYDDLGLSPEEMQNRMGKWFAWSEKMKEQGILRGGEALHSHGKRVSGTERIVTDGPFVESKELVGGFYQIEVADYDAAVIVAQDYPDYDLEGAVEIRETIQFDR